MDGHFRAFSFVDKIQGIEAGTTVRSHYRIPDRLPAFPLSLVAEAIGQTAAWAAMAAVDFQRRPVAGLAERVELLSEARPGATLKIRAELHSVEDDAVAYDGVARIDEREVVWLRDCLGPMVPLEDYDSPASVRERFGLLLETGVTPGGFGGLPSLELANLEYLPEHRLLAKLQTPASADFYADHFPRRPVLPGTLLMDANLRLARSLLLGAEPSDAGADWSPVGIRNMKLRDFVCPGECLEIEARLKERHGSSARVIIQTQRAGRAIGSAHVLLKRKASS